MEQDSRVIKLADRSPEEVMASLQTTDMGLSVEEVARRRQQYGRNEIEAKQVSAWLKLLGFFWGPSPA